MSYIFDTTISTSKISIIEFEKYVTAHHESAVWILAPTVKVSLGKTPQSPQLLPVGPAAAAQ